MMNRKNMLLNVHQPLQLYLVRDTDHGLSIDFASCSNTFDPTIFPLKAEGFSR